MAKIKLLQLVNTPHGVAVVLDWDVTRDEACVVMGSDGSVQWYFSSLVSPLEYSVSNSFPIAVMGNILDRLRTLGVRQPLNLPKSIDPLQSDGVLCELPTELESKSEPEQAKEVGEAHGEASVAQRQLEDSKARVQHLETLVKQFENKLNQQTRTISALQQEARDRQESHAVTVALLEDKIERRERLLVRLSGHVNSPNLTSTLLEVLDEAESEVAEFDS